MAKIKEKNVLPLVYKSKCYSCGKSYLTKDYNDAYGWECDECQELPTEDEVEGEDEE